MKIICILDYCKTKACSIGVIPYIGAIIFSYRCDKLLILGYISAQVVDSKVGEMIYPLQKVNLIKFIQNEPISIRNTREVHKNANLIGFLNQLAVLPYLAKTLRTLTD